MLRSTMPSTWTAIGRRGAPTGPPQPGSSTERTLAVRQWHLEREPEASLRRGMPCPNRWYLYFTSYMPLAEVYRGPTQHFEHHLRQLTFPAADADGNKDEPEVTDRSPRLGSTAPGQLGRRSSPASSTCGICRRPWCRLSRPA
jgi:hypothetical protein